MYYIVTDKHDPEIMVITEGENTTDAMLNFFRNYTTTDDYDNAYNEAGGCNALAEQLLTDYDCTETYRAMVLEWVERRLDGDRNITILL